MDTAKSFSTKKLCGFQLPFYKTLYFSWNPKWYFTPRDNVAFDALAVWGEHRTEALSPNLITNINNIDITCCHIKQLVDSILIWINEIYLKMLKGHLPPGKTSYTRCLFLQKTCYYFLFSKCSVPTLSHIFTSAEHCAFNLTTIACGRWNGDPAVRVRKGN